MNETTDRRVRRTRATLHRALIELLLERPYERITVRDILDRADVGRSTFYAHFRDKDDLLLVSSTEYLRAAITAAHPEDPAAPPISAPLAPVYTLFQLAQANPEVYRALLGRKAGGQLLRATRGMVGRVLTEQLFGRFAMDDEEFTAMVNFLSWGVAGTLGAIADADPPIPAEVAYRRLETLLGPGLAARTLSQRTAT
ncbi:transcriptional regulator, TetR family [Nocardia amikacinitolerans]|uniref:TetR/AcrR family transcriptional regulator n=1 Tax=Nocardia amikacinitolerans TaxID=756689 RepID=UPI00083186AD|nr:TetR/AcrR family transcriptional regulator [Nocardia amikacinitolerans]MCP2320419.1 transcriptional regulator, TetR family [Nocardia amikacinitolerans]